jgi:hypothetical protein
LLVYEYLANKGYNEFNCDRGGMDRKIITATVKITSLGMDVVEGAR